MPGRVHLAWVLFAILVASACGRSATSSDSGLSAEERSAMPGVIAFVSERGQDRDIWLVRPSGAETRFTSGIEDDFPAAFTSDGRQLLVIATREIDGVHREQLRLYDVAAGPTGKPVLLNAPRGRARNPSFAPDGSFFVSESDEQGFSDLVLMGPQQPPRRLTSDPKGSFEPRVSPDGRRIAFVSSRDGNPEIYVMDVDGTAAQARRLTEHPREDGAPLWSPDGTHIAFLSHREKRRVRAYLMRADGSQVRPLSGATDTGDERELAWRPDGSAIALVGRKSATDTQIYVAPVATAGDARALTSGAKRSDQPAWSPDGKHLVYVSEHRGEADLYLMRADGSGQTQLTNAVGADWLPRWAPVSSADRSPGTPSSAAPANAGADVAAAAAAARPATADVSADSAVIAARASEFRRAAEKLEPSVTPMLQELASQVGGVLHGLQHRFKSQSSLQRKIHLKMRQEQLTAAQVNIYDALRYTILVDDEPAGHYTKSVRDTLASLEPRGHRVVAVKNYWPRGDSYSGVNVVLEASSKLQWEIQFHTAASAETQKKSHPLYSEQRKIDTPLARKRELFDQMTTSWEQVPIPAQVLDARSLHALEKPVKYARP